MRPYLTRTTVCDAVRAESREQRTESTEHRAQSREQRAESREQRAESREQRDTYKPIASVNTSSTVIFQKALGLAAYISSQ
jgi:hypothetical protein